MMYKSLVLLAAIALPAHSAPTIDGGNVTFSGSTWWQVEIPWDQGGGVVCDSANNPSGCFLNDGQYKWVQGTQSGNINISTSSGQTPLAQPSVTYHQSTQVVEQTAVDSPPFINVSCDTGVIMATACTIRETGKPDRLYFNHWSRLVEDQYTCGVQSFEDHRAASASGRVEYEITAYYSCLIFN